MDTTDINITFNSDGICHNCTNFFNNIQSKWDKSRNGKLKHKLIDIVEKIKSSGRNNEFDCILGFSGGCDSSYMLHMMVTEFNLRPLVIHVDGGWNTKDAAHNIRCLIDKLNLELYVKVINWEEMRSLQLAYFKSGVSNLDTPQDHAFFATQYHFAKKHKKSKNKSARI